MYHVSEARKWSQAWIDGEKGREIRVVSGRVPVAIRTSRLVLLFLLID